MTVLAPNGALPSTARLLELTNTILGSIGEAPIDDLEDAHAHRDSIVGTIHRVAKNVQARGWWFNKDCVTLSPAALTNEVELPGDALGVYSKDPNFVQRGQLLVDKSTGSSEFAAAVEAWIVKDIPLEDLPQLAFDAISAEAVYRYQRNYDGDSTKTRDLRAERDTAMADLRDEDTRQTKANLIFANPSLRKIAVLAQRLAR